MPARYWDLHCLSTDATSSWHQLPLCASAAAQLAPAHAGHRLDFLVRSYKTREPGARTSEGTATQGKRTFTYTDILPAFTVCMNKGQGLRTPSGGEPSGGRAAGPGKGNGTTGNFQVVSLGFPSRSLQSMKRSLPLRFRSNFRGRQAPSPPGSGLQQPEKGLPTAQGRNQVSARRAEDSRPHSSLGFQDRVRTLVKQAA